jgi:hypothetical protein
VEVTRAAGGVSMASPMGFAEALSDDCASPPRLPWVPWSICGLMTVIGGVATPYLSSLATSQSALIAAVLVVVIELGVISWVRHRDMDPAALGSAADRIG